jgi:hypothetical protein
VFGLLVGRVVMQVFSWKGPIISTVSFNLASGFR